MDKLYVIKIGGNIVDNVQTLDDFLHQFSQLEGLKILVHGGGKIATEIAKKLNIKQTMIDGRRVTDRETLDVVTMVYGGLINKNLVAKLNSFGLKAIGLTGADGQMIRAHKRFVEQIDYGFAGDIDDVNGELIDGFLKSELTPVIAPLTSDASGSMLNTNADTMAQAIAIGMSNYYDVDLIYSFEKAGVLLDVEDEATSIPRLDPLYYKILKQENKIFDGMIPKLDNAFFAIERGVKTVVIGNGMMLKELVTGKKGTLIFNPLI